MHLVHNVVDMRFHCLLSNVQNDSDFLIRETLQKILGHGPFPGAQPESLLCHKGRVTSPRQALYENKGTGSLSARLKGTFQYHCA